MTSVRTFGDLALRRSAGQATILRDVLLVLGGSLLVAVCARIQAPTWPVPITLQPFAVLLVGAALGSRRGALAMVTYLMQGLVGLPVFAMPPYAGPAYLAGPTGGFLLGFVLAAYIVGLLAERGWDRRFASALAAMAIGQCIILATGFAWLSPLLGASNALAEAVTPFIVGDIFKVLLAAIALPAAWRLLRKVEAL